MGRYGRDCDRGRNADKNHNGVIRNPPPMPNMPETKPTASPIPNSKNTLNRQVGDREIDFPKSQPDGATNEAPDLRRRTRARGGGSTSIGIELRPNAKPFGGQHHEFACLRYAKGPHPEEAGVWSPPQHVSSV